MKKSPKSHNDHKVELEDRFNGVKLHNPGRANAGKTKNVASFRGIQVTGDLQAHIMSMSSQPSAKRKCLNVVEEVQCTFMDETEACTEALKNTMHKLKENANHEGARKLCRIIANFPTTQIKQEECEQPPTQYAVKDELFDFNLSDFAFTDNSRLDLLDA